ncbi:O-antigen translocase [Vibrio maritimus]|uniref:O-antigen translocase n=1 Tax=Vibrio maritimus TaxID=990268 RepID=UPI003735BD15
MNDRKQSYARILKSSSLIGGAQGINMLIGMIRVKCVAILIGPIGIGLVATYQSLMQMLTTVAGLGLQSSAVRDISKAVANGDIERTARIVLSLRRMCFLTGSLGSISVILLSPILSDITFNSLEHKTDIALIGLTILFANLRGGQMALIQGYRNISDLAKLNVIGTILGSLISVVLYWLLGLKGIVPALLALSTIELASSWWFARKIPVPQVSMKWSESLREAGGMIKMGLAFMWNGLMIAIVAYLTRLIITQEISLLAVGIFAAAFALSGMIVNFILGAMGADYYPSLTAINNDNKKMRVLVNQQTEIGLLLAIPGIIATLAFSPLIIKLFYTSDFSQSSELLRWFIIGCIGRVLSWPMGFIILAKGFSKIFVFTETTINIIHIILIVVLLSYFGIEGVAIAYPILYTIYTVMMLVVSKYLIDFKWSREVINTLLLVITFTSIVFVSIELLTQFQSSIVGLVVTFIVSVFCINKLSERLGSEHKLNKILNKSRLLRRKC